MNNQGIEILRESQLHYLSSSSSEMFWHALPTAYRGFPDFKHWRPVSVPEISQ